MPNPNGSAQWVGLGSFAVDFRAGELLKDGRRIRLQDEPLQVLAMLVEHPVEHSLAFRMERLQLPEVRSRCGLVMFPLLFEIGHELHETRISPDVVQVGI